LREYLEGIVDQQRNPTMTATTGGRQILIHGLFFILVGLLWGLAVPHTPYPRLALGAHIQFEQSGLLYLAMAILLLKVPNRVGCKSVGVMLLSVWLTWLMAFSEVANSWWGTIQMLPIAAHEAGATGGTSGQELVVKLAHIIAGIALILAWILLIIGFVKTPATSTGE
jgi:(hydroxyamino)benzene mutase